MTLRWYVGRVHALGRSSLVAVALSATVFAVGCGDDESTGENTKVNLQLVSATFPERQELAKQATMSIVVRNPGDEPVEMVTATVSPGGTGETGSAFQAPVGGVDASDSSRPIWIVDEAPLNGVTADSAVTRLGPVEAGKTVAFKWKVTPVRTGKHPIRWAIGADLKGEKTVIDDAGEPIEGRFDVEIGD